KKSAGKPKSRSSSLKNRPDGEKWARESKKREISAQNLVGGENHVRERFWSDRLAATVRAPGPTRTSTDLHGPVTGDHPLSLCVRSVRARPCSPLDNSMHSMHDHAVGIALSRRPCPSTTSTVKPASRRSWRSSTPGA